MQTQSLIALVAALSLLASAPLAQAKNNLKKPLIERIDGALAKAKRTRESRALISEQQRKEKAAAKQKAQQKQASAPVAPQRLASMTKQPECVFRLLFYVADGLSFSGCLLIFNFCIDRNLKNN